MAGGGGEDDDDVEEESRFGIDINLYARTSEGKERHRHNRGTGRSGQIMEVRSRKHCSRAEFEERIFLRVLYYVQPRYAL